MSDPTTPAAPTPPTIAEIWDAVEDDGNGTVLTIVYEHSDPSYRHGEYRTQVYHRSADETFWKIRYAVSGDGENNDLREAAEGSGYGRCAIDPKRVYPHQVTTTVYKATPAA